MTNANPYTSLLRVVSLLDKKSFLYEENPKWHKVLGISPLSSSDQIKQAHRSLIILLHPDKKAQLKSKFDFNINNEFMNKICATLNNAKEEGLEEDKEPWTLVKHAYHLPNSTKKIIYQNIDQAQKKAKEVIEYTGQILPVKIAKNVSVLTLFSVVLITICALELGVNLLSFLSSYGRNKTSYNHRLTDQSIPLCEEEHLRPNKEALRNLESDNIEELKQTDSRTIKSPGKRR